MAASGSSGMGASYANDSYTWTQEQGAHLRASDFASLDLENLAEEIEGLGRGEFNRLVVAFREILAAMLIIDRCSAPPPREAALNIAVQRLKVAFLIIDSPGLASKVDAAMARAYPAASLRVAAATGLPLSRFPEPCPYDDEEMLNRIFAVDPDDTTD